MDTAEWIKSPKVDHVLMYRNGSRKATKGTLFLTATHVIFIDSKTQAEIFILYMVIHSVKAKSPIKKAGKEGTPLLIHCKNFQILELVIPRAVDAVHVTESIKHFAFPTELEDLFAFQYTPDYDTDVDGWTFFDHQAEYARFGVPNESWVCSPVNHQYKLCPSYTAWLYVPAAMKPSELAQVAKFRSKGRLPALSYLYQGKTALLRCAQPCSGVQSKRNAFDELLIQRVFEANPSGKNVIIVDTRPKINAIANKAKGKGFENMQGYPNAQLVWHGIENIHAMRESLGELLKALRETDSMSSYLKAMDDAKWLSHVRAVISCTLNIVKYIIDGHSVAIHCSDGWDRTAQTCSLAGFMLEPYYRTIRGFIALVEKEWLGFGHKMSDRNQFLAGHNSEVSPIFLQFLECTWQISQQYPRAFEFNELFLITIHDCLVSSQFGTFLCNFEQQRKQAKLSERTRSVWSYLYSRREDFLNPLYDIGEPAHQAYLFPELGSQHFKVWSSMYSRFDPEIQPRQSYMTAVSHLSLRTELDQHAIKVLTAKIARVKAKLKNSTSDADSEAIPKEETQPEKEGEDKPAVDATPETSVTAEVTGATPETSVTAEVTGSANIDNEPVVSMSDSGADKVEKSSPKSTKKRPSGISPDDLFDDDEDEIKADIEAIRNVSGGPMSPPLSPTSTPSTSLTTSPETPSYRGKRLAKSRASMRTVKQESLKINSKIEVTVPPEELLLPPTLEDFLTVDACTLCKIPFDYASHRQHCRICGKIFCGNCAAIRVSLPKLTMHVPVPVCNTCKKKNQSS